MSGQRNRPTPLALIRQKVEANRAKGLGVAFFSLESLWSLGPEPAAERLSGLANLFGDLPGQPLLGPPLPSQPLPGTTPPPDLPPLP